MAFLTIQPKEGDVREVVIEQDETTIGRASENTITIDDPSASGRHCAIFRQGGRFTLRDLNSTNGTYLNGAKIGECLLAPGDILNVGALRMTFDGDDIETGTTPAADLETGPQDTIRVGAGQAGGRPPEFNLRRKRTGMWFTISLLIGFGLLALVYLFLSGLFWK